MLGEAELHTLAEYLAARLRDWPCVGAAAAACRALLQPPGPGAGDGGGAAQLRDDSGLLVLEAAAEMLRSAQSFRQEERSSLLQLLLAAARGRWGRLAARAEKGVPLLDAFLGAADGEKDPRCLMLAFEAVQALCEMHHIPGADAGPLRQLADEVADWASSYFPISFNPRGPAAISRADLAAALEAALAASPFLAGGVLPLLVEKLSSTYRPAKEDSLSALRRCCPAYGPDALAPHLAQLWQALRAEVMAPSGHGGAGALPMGGAGAGAGPEAESRLALAAAAAGCLTVVVRAAGPGAMDALALQDACVGDLVAVVRGAGSRTRGSSAQAIARADSQVLCGSEALAAVAAAGPLSLRRAHTAALGAVQAALAESLAPTDGYDSRADQTLYGMTVLAAVVDAVAAELRLAGVAGGGGAAAVAAAAARTWLVSGAADGFAALAELKGTLLAALAAVHFHVHPDAAGAAAILRGADTLPPSSGGTAPGGSSTADKAMAVDEEPGQPGCYSQAAAAQLRLAAVAAWGSLLRLHDAAAGAAAAAAAAGGGGGAAALLHLMLSAAELTAAAEQLCACALAAGAAAAAVTAAGPQTPSRMRWGRPVDAAQEAAAELQLLLQLTPLQPPPAAAGGGGDGRDDVNAGDADTEPGPVVRILVERLTAAMSGGGGGGDAAEVRAAALRLAVQLTQHAAPEQRVQQPEPAAGGGGGEGRGGAVAFAAALLAALPQLLLRRGSAEDDEEWLRDCLTQLATRVLPPLAARGPAPSPAPAPAPATQQPSGRTAAAAATAAAHALTVATLAAAAEYDAAGGTSGGSGGGAVLLPFRGTSEAETGPAAGPAPLLAAWCAAVQQLTACCDDRQQLELALEAAERIAACSAHAVSDPAAAAAAAATCAGLPLACAVVAGLRAGVLAPQSTQALADSLLRLLVAASKPPPASGIAAAADLDLAPAAVALAAAVNRWQDGPSLDAWLESAFRPALLGRLAGGVAAADWGASVAAVQAVGWLGRALALRNHPALREVLEALLACLRAEPSSAAAGGPSSDTGMEVDREPDVAMDGSGAAGGSGGPGAQLTGSTGSDGQAAHGSAAAVAAAGAFGVLVAEAAEAGGVALAATPPQAVCRVLWQQRTYSLCAQALEEAYHGHLQQQQGQQGQGQSLRLPLQMAVAVARLAGSAPRPMCRNDATRLAPLLLRSVRTLCGVLRGNPGAVAASSSCAVESAGPAAAAMAAALREALVVVRDWLGGPKALPSAQLEKVLTDQVGALVECVCAAAELGAGAPPGRAGAPRPPALTAAAAASHTAAQTLAAPRVDAALAAAVREEAMCCCSGLMDSLPYHVLHPLRQQVLSCVLRALDDNRRSVRQLAVRARRAWGDI